MVERMEITVPEGAKNLTQVARALEKAAVAASYMLEVDHDNLLAKCGCLWMLVRYQIRLQRIPVGALRVETFLRSPKAAFSLRDFTIFDQLGEAGQAVQTWVVVDEKERKVKPMSVCADYLTAPTPVPERTTKPLRFKPSPDMTLLGTWLVRPEQIDANGHLNNVAYLQEAEQYVTGEYTALDVAFDRECFAGEKLSLVGSNEGETRFICIRKENGDLSFSARFGKEKPE
ncbi:MAG: hypothetical protein IJA48_01930 [Oscillospiraceae bacterium]|nr:hypothetical protein [Oscillospiraceae bacterium]